MDFSVKCDTWLSREAGNALRLQYAGATNFRADDRCRNRCELIRNCRPKSWTMPESGNRYFRLIAPPGAFRIAYDATVRLEHPKNDPTRCMKYPPASCR